MCQVTGYRDCLAEEEQYCCRAEVRFVSLVTQVESCQLFAKDADTLLKGSSLRCQTALADKAEDIHCVFCHCFTAGIIVGG